MSKHQFWDQCQIMYNRGLLADFSSVRPASQCELRKNQFVLIFCTIFIELQDKIVLPFTHQYGHEFLLNEFKGRQKKKNGVDAIFADFKYLLKGYRFFLLHPVQHIATAL